MSHLANFMNTVRSVSSALRALKQHTWFSLPPTQGAARHNRSEKVAPRPTSLTTQITKTHSYTMTGGREIDR